MKRGYIITISLIILISIGSLIYYSITRPTPDLTASEKEILAKCLTQKGIYLYGTINCPNCDVQKEKFGEAIKDIVYINCFVQKENCTKYSEQKIYPYWGMDETVIVGPIPLDKLKEKTNC